MIGAHPVDAVRAAEATAMALLPPGALMQRAAAALAAVAAAELRARRGAVAGARVLLLVGGGNNGGDALFAGARLARRGVAVTALLASARAHPEGTAALRAAGGRVHTALGGDDGPLTGDLVLDALVGLGGSPGLREPALGLVERLAPGVPVLAVDLPSGVDPDSGRTPLPHLSAAVTVSFGTAKPCLLLPPAAAAAGRLELVDLGLLDHLPPSRLTRLEAADVAARWPWPRATDDKYHRGVVGAVVGSPAYPGAAVLAVGGALRSGAGMVRHLGPEPVTDEVRRAWPEVVAGLGRVQAWVLGSGVDPEPGGGSGGQAEWIRSALASGRPCVVDAGALTVLAGLLQADLAAGRRPRRFAGSVLTPHAGELARFCATVGRRVDRAEVLADPLRHAREAASASGATVLVKGAVTVVVDPPGPDGEPGAVRSQAEAPPWLATAGAGDVLAGVIGTLLAAGVPALDAAAMAAFVHGRAASLAAARAGGAQGGPIIASDLLDLLPAAVAALRPAAAGAPSVP